MRNIFRLLGVARELWPYYLGIVLASVGTAVTALVTPFLIKAATDAVVAEAQGHGTGVWPLVAIAAWILAVELANTLLTNVGGYLGDTMAVRLKALLSSRYYAKLLALPQRYFDRELSGTIINRLSRSITETTQFTQMFSNTFFPMLLTVVAVLVITAFYSPWLALLLFCIYPLFMWLTTLTSKRWQGLEQRKNDEFDRAGGRFAEAIGQVRVVKSFLAEARELRLFNARYRRSTELTAVQSRYWHGMDVARRAALNLIFFAIYAIIFVQTARGAFSLGVMVLLLQLIAMAKTPVTMMSFVVDAGQHAIAGSRSYLEVLDEPEESQPALTPAAALSLRRPETTAAALAAAQREADHPGEWPATPGAPMISFDHVSFGYDEEHLVLADITVDIARGERVALVGESGGGKTTLVNLLLGLYRPEAGAIRILGADIAQLPVTRLRREIGVVFQDASLFSGTIRENVAYGDPAASDAQILEALRRAHAADFIARLSDGIDAEIGERGVKLSGGQKQRIAVARAMLKNAPILVLDEATSALDSKAERLVQQGLEDLMRDRTAIIIAHRLSTISSVDRIITLADGRIDEIGTPAQLARSGGIYAELLALQASATKTDRKRLQAFDITG